MKKANKSPCYSGTGCPGSERPHAPARDCTKCVCSIPVEQPFRVSRATPGAATGSPAERSTPLDDRGPGLRS